MKITEEQLLKLNRAQGLLMQVQNELMNEDDRKLPEQRTGRWTVLYTACEVVKDVVNALKND